MHGALDSLIEINGRTYAWAGPLDIARAANKLIGTCTLTVPRRGGFGGKSLRESVQPGNPVSVLVGYSGTLSTEFVGYVRRVLPGNPAKIECEDSAAIFRNLKVTGNFKDVKLNALLGQIQPFPVESTNLDLGDVHVEGTMTVLEFLDWLRSDYGLRIFFRLNGEGEPVLVGSAAGLDSSVRKRVNLMQQPRQGDQLRWQDSEELEVRINAIHFKADGTRETKAFGKAGGIELSQTYYNTPAWEQLAQALVDKARFDGYTGELACIGYASSLQPGQVLTITDARYPERDGSYYSLAQRVRFGPSGLTITHTLGPQAS